jgi:hypothetical protein
MQAIGHGYHHYQTPMKMDRTFPTKTSLVNNNLHSTTLDPQMAKGSWLIDYLLLYVPRKNFSLIWRRHHCRWRVAKFRPMLGAQGHWAGRDLYRATPAMTQGLGFSGLIRRTAPISCLLRHARGCKGSILTWVLAGAREREGGQEHHGGEQR